MVLLCPLDGWDAVGAGVEPVGVVPVDPAEDGPASVGPGRVDPALDALPLERLPERLGHGVVPAHPGPADRRAELPGPEVIEIVVRGVLRAAVGVDDHAGDGLVAARACRAMPSASRTSSVRMW